MIQMLKKNILLTLSLEFSSQMLNFLIHFYELSLKISWSLWDEQIKKKLSKKKNYSKNTQLLINPHI